MQYQSASLISIKPPCLCIYYTYIREFQEHYFKFQASDKKLANEYKAKVE